MLVGNTVGVNNSSTLTHTTTADNSQRDFIGALVVDRRYVRARQLRTGHVIADKSIHETTHTDAGSDAHLGF
jgi:hypothetical protein